MIRNALALLGGWGEAPTNALDQLWMAQAEWNPPAQYDKPFPGRMLVRQMPPRQVPGACQQMFDARGMNLTAGFGQRGCAVQVGDQCQVITIDRPAYGTTPDAVRRHERGHCNGWGADHGG